MKLLVRDRHELAVLTKRERKELVRLLGILQDHLESAIDSSLIGGTRLPMHGAEREVARDRKDWRTAEDWVMKLTRPAARKAARA